MTYVDNNDVATAVFHIIEGVIEPICGKIPPERYSDVADRIKSIIGQFTGIHTADGVSRLYSIDMIEEDGKSILLGE